MHRDVLSSRPRAGTTKSARGSVLGVPQTVGGLVSDIASRLGDFDEPQREAKELVAGLLDVPKHWPLLHENKWIEADTWTAALHAAKQRAAGAPLAYAVGRANFRGLTLDVDERVLIPRPETELLVDLVLARCSHGVVADVGTGSGAIALALASEGHFDRVIATDVSLDALEVASSNARKFGVANVEFVQGDLLAGLDRATPFGIGGSGFGVGGLSAVVSNPPYISFSEIPELPASVRDWEPAVALFSADDGMAATTGLVHQAADCLRGGGLLALEVDARRASLVAELVATDGRYSDVSVQLDYGGRERFVLANRAHPSVSEGTRGRLTKTRVANRLEPR